MENWRFIEENPDYMISDHGRVLSFKGKSKLILCTKIIGTGYETVSLLNKGICTDYNVHRLIAKAFIPNPKHLPQINHLDGNTMNNHVSNLEWCDAYTNTMHAIRTGLRPTGTGSRKTPCAVTDAKGIILRAYPSMKEMGREERLKPSHQHWLILQLKHPDRVWLHNLRARQHRGNDFMKVPFANSSALSQLPVFLNSLAITDTAVPPLHSGAPLGDKAILPSTVCRGGCRLRIHLPYYTQTRKEDFTMRDTIIIHCSATRAGQDFTAADIDRWHRQRGFRSIGYHFVVRLDGTVEPGRDVALDGAHCTGWNHRSIGICYIGGLDKNGRPADTRTEAQREALVRLVEDLRLVFPSLQQVIGHRDTSPDLNGDGIISPNEYIKSCPCFDVKAEFIQ